MEKKERIPRKEAYAEFLEWREKLNSAQDSRAKFEKLFEEAIKGAGEDDAIMQDVVAYYYKNGVERLLDEDYKKYMDWEILSAANGNEFAIEKLQFFMGYAYDQIVESKEFPKIKYYNGINEYNYIQIIGQELCMELVNKLSLSSEVLAKARDVFLPYRPEYFRDYRKAIDEVLPIVIEKMSQKKD